MTIHVFDQNFNSIMKTKPPGERPTSAPIDDHVHQERIADESAHLRTLCEIMTASPLHFEEQVNRALQEGLAMLQLDLGIVSNIVGNNYTILFFSPFDAPLEKNQTFDLNTTYCSLTVKNKDVIAIDHMANSIYSGHPCYSSFSLESYIGVPIFVEGLTYGTLNFSSTVPRSTPFTEEDKNFVRLMGRWIGTCLASNTRNKELQRYRIGLEKLVTERTTELRNANEQLRTEIADNELARKSLQKQQVFLNTLIETIPIPVFYKDISGRYLGCNKAFEHFSQKPRSEIIGKTVFDMAPKEIAEKYEEKDRELFENPGTQQYEWKYRKSGGEDRSVIFKKAPFADESGRIAGLVGSVFDITDRIKKDKQFIQAQKLQAISTLSSGIAHDFNNILSVMMGYTELARMKLSDDSQVHTDLDKAYAAGKKAVELVKQILTFSRPSDQTIQPVKVGPIIKEVLKFMQTSLPANIDIRHSILKEATILADPTQLRQVLMNLCTNSWHAMMAKGGVLEVTLDATTIEPESAYSQAGLSAGSFVKIQVKDTGPGIPQNIIERIFDPFFSTKDPGEGTGLGLSVVHGIIKNLGGAIQVTSNPDAGSVFEIIIPMAEERSETASIEREAALPHGSENILFVDDEELIVDLGKQLFEKLGYLVTGCTSSIEALKIFKNNPHKFDLVITDETMPKLTGKMLAAELNIIRPETPIILCSGLVSDIDKDDAAAKGIKAFILKPMLTKTISKIVREVLDGTYSGQ